jgi:SAM-dependent methyltransferase
MSHDPVRVATRSEGEYRYVGSELEVCSLATNWKQRLARELGPFLGSRVLEVGAGLGETTIALISDRQQAWTLLEPDARLADRALKEARRLPAVCDVRVGGIADLPGDACFDSVVYVDVLEHIEDDVGELRRAAGLLESGGHLVVLSPAHQWLFSPFDASIGHHRRYSRASLLAVAPKHLELVRLRYLDSAGMLAVAANRLALRQSLPTAAQILFWDRALVRLSTVVDPMLGYRVGRSVLGVWRAG